MPFAGGRALDRRDLGLLVDLGAAGARPFAQRHGQIGRRDVAVVGVIERADEVRRVAAVAELDQRPELLHFLGRDDLEGHADGVGGAAVLLILVHAVAAGREAQIPGDVEAHVLSGFCRQALVEIDGVLVQLPDRVAHIEQRQEARRVPGGSGGELRALEQHHVRPAFVRQVIERADAYHAATDHHDAGMSFHRDDPPDGNALRSVTSGRPNNTPIATIACVNAPWPCGETLVGSSDPAPRWHACPSKKRQTYVGNGQSS